jgi:ArsR family transcriptional regulator
MDRRMQAATRLLRTLADPTRLRILALLGDGDVDVCVCDIHRSLRIAQPKASRHLAELRRAGLVTARREGLWVHYRRVVPADPALAQVLESVLHALPHSDTVRRDASALSRATGCAPPAAGPAAARARSAAISP